MCADIVALEPTQTSNTCFSFALSDVISDVIALTFDVWSDMVWTTCILLPVSERTFTLVSSLAVTTNVSSSQELKSTVLQMIWRLWRPHSTEFCILTTSGREAMFSLLFLTNTNFWWGMDRAHDRWHPPHGSATSSLLPSWEATRNLLPLNPVRKVLLFMWTKLSSHSIPHGARTVLSNVKRFLSSTLRMLMKPSRPEESMKIMAC